MLEYLVAEHGWEKLHKMTAINVFGSRPTIKSGLKMLRKNSWAREKIEQLYAESFRKK
ncbi:UNVERIFIED_CONTAM: hypothetical protein GTU68_027234 [Idotea baltica]|nr:hypothetical protein [Idotea baltica]